MEPRWSLPVPQAMQRHGGPPKNVPVLARAKESVSQPGAAQLAPDASINPQNQVFDRAA
jgi:hypothetical protein